MKKLKTIFSPRNLAVWLLIIVLIVAVPDLDEPAMSKTEAIVTTLCVDKVEDKIQIATTVLAPAEDKKVNLQVYSGEGATLGEAMGNVSLLIGKEMGFAQTQILALGTNLCKDSIMPTLDYMTRTKKVGRNTVLINFEGDIKDFTNAVSNLNVEKSLRLEEIINFDQRYVLTKDSNVESFYKGYFSNITLGIMPQIKLTNEENPTSIEIEMKSGGTSSGSSSGSSSASSGGSSGASSSGESSKKYLVNDGTTCVFKDGKLNSVVSAENMRRVNIFLNDAQKGEIKVENVSDDLYNDATVVCSLRNKDISLKPSFKNGKPTYKADLELVIVVEEVDEKLPSDKFLQRNKDFVTPTLIEKLKETVSNEMEQIIDYCKTNKIDLIGVYRNFYHRQYKDFMNYIDKVGTDNYLDGIDYQIEISVTTEY